MQYIRLMTLTLIIIFSILNSLFGREYPPGGDEGTWVVFRYYVNVEDQDGNPLSGIRIRMIATYYLWENYDWQAHTVVKEGGTDNNGFVLLEKWVDVTGYWPDDYNFSNMYVEMISEDYTVMSSTNISSNYPTASGSFVIILDRDGDEIDDNLESYLAEKFKPILHKHSYDLQQNLDSFDRILQGGYLTLKVFNDLGQLLINTQAISGDESAVHKWDTWHWDTYGWGSVSHGFYVLDIHDSQRYIGAPNGQRPLYYHVYYDGSYYYIQYWYFLGMNDIREQLPGIADNWHEGDWEHVSIRILQQSGSYIPDKINFYLHDGGRTYNASECWWSATNAPTYNDIHQGYVDNQYTHLHIWIAANSHASYNRYSTVYERNVLGIDYHDRVDYSSNGNDLYFEYDVLIKLGEVMKLTYTQCPISGYSLEYHCYPIKFSKHWLAYLGRVGSWNSPPFGATPSPTMPSNESISHEWRNFTIDFSGFGNDGAHWIWDDSTGD